jgi:hypothetical protein
VYYIHDIDILEPQTPLIPERISKFPRVDVSRCPERTYVTGRRASVP